MSGQEQELFKGHTGQVTIDGEALVISRRGLSKVAGAAGAECRIPLASLSAVAMKPATRMLNGSLRLGVSGAEPPAEKDAVASPTAVVFTWQQREPFERLHGWLSTVVERNRTHGDAPPPGQLGAGTEIGEAQHGEHPLDTLTSGASGVALTVTSPETNSLLAGGIDPEAATSAFPGADEGPEPSGVSNWAPNWYPDPTGRFQFRYWDGAVWTEHVAGDGAQGTDPVTHSAPAEVPNRVGLVGTAVGPASAEPADAPKKSGVLARMREERHAKAVGRDEFEALAMRAAAGDPAAVAALPQALASARTLYRAGALETKLWETMAAAVRGVIDDDVLSLEEEQHLHRLGQVLGTPVQDLERRNYPLFEEIVIAGINGGRLPRLDGAGIMLKGGEVAHASFNASLMKEQAVREYRAGVSAVSVPLGHGVRYRIGGVRGRSVVVGSELVVQDSGQLFVTSQRVLFTGQAKTLEFRNDRLVGLQQYADGLRLNVSNRQAASLFKMNAPSIAAALISASVARNA